MYLLLYFKYITSNLSCTLLRVLFRSTLPNTDICADARISCFMLMLGWLYYTCLSRDALWHRTSRHVSIPCSCAHTFCSKYLAWNVFFSASLDGKKNINSVKCVLQKVCAQEHVMKQWWLMWHHCKLCIEINFQHPCSPCLFQPLSGAVPKRTLRAPTPTNRLGNPTLKRSESLKENLVRRCRLLQKC